MFSTAPAGPLGGICASQPALNVRKPCQARTRFSGAQASGLPPKKAPNSVLPPFTALAKRMNDRGTNRQRKDEPNAGMRLI